MANHPSIVDQISSECLLGHWRRVNRVLTGIYQAEMRDWGLKSSQLNLLVAVAKTHCRTIAHCEACPLRFDPHRRRPV